MCVCVRACVRACVQQGWGGGVDREGGGGPGHREGLGWRGTPKDT